MNTRKITPHRIIIATLALLLWQWSAGCGGGGGAVEATPAPTRWTAAQEVDCAGIERPVVLMLAGQSQLTNGIPDRNYGLTSVYAFWGGKCYTGVDPLPGSALTGGTIASRLGDLLAARSGRNVLLVNYGVGGTAIAEWLPGTKLNDTLLSQIDALAEAGLEPDALLWMQGESDTDAVLGTSQADYVAMFGQLLASIRTRTDATVVVAIETLMYGVPDADIRAAQLSLAKKYQGVKTGPDLDTLGLEYRKQDGIHFNTPGAEAGVVLWRNAL